MDFRGRFKVDLVLEQARKELEVFGGQFRGKDSEPDQEQIFRKTEETKREEE